MNAIKADLLHSKLLCLVAAHLDTARFFRLKRRPRSSEYHGDVSAAETAITAAFSIVTKSCLNEQLAFNRLVEPGFARDYSVA